MLKTLGAKDVFRCGERNGLPARVDNTVGAFRSGREWSKIATNKRE